MNRVLIVDDQPSIRLFIKSILDGLGLPMVVEFANDGNEALRAIAKQLPDLVITDIFMPRMDGIELIESIKKRKVQPLIIAISDSDIDHQGNSLYLECAKLVGAEYCVRKSDLVTDLGITVRSCLNQCSHKKVSDF